MAYCIACYLTIAETLTGRWLVLLRDFLNKLKLNGMRGEGESYSAALVDLVLVHRAEREVRAIASNAAEVMAILIMAT